MAQSPWKANHMATARNVGTAGCVFFINLAHIWLQVIAFFGGGYRLTWFGALSQQDWTLPYESSLRLF